MANELKPCPFCGREPKRQENRAGGVVIFCNSAECELLSVNTEAADERENEAAIAAWNYRPAEDRLRAALEATQTKLNDVTEVLQRASDHLDYCGYGDSWEREGSEGLRENIESALKEGQ